MAVTVKHRRGSSTAHEDFTGAQGEITVDTDENTAVVHDGETQGGHKLARVDQLGQSDEDIIQQANDYTDQEVADLGDALETNLQTYADDAADNAEVMAKGYTDQEVDGLLNEANTYTDNQVDGLLNDANNYTDDQVEGLAGDWESYADDAADAARQDAELYADAQVTDLEADLEPRVQNYADSAANDAQTAAEAHAEDEVAGHANSGDHDDRYLQQANNLSDVNASDARSNLGLGSAATRDVTVSTSIPSSGTGSDGDLWFVVED